MRTAVVLLGLVGCTSGSSGPPPVTVFPTTTLFSGVDPAGGGATYKVTIAASGPTGITWSTSDTAIATVTGTDTLGTVVSLKEGNAMIRVTDGNSTVAVPLLVTSYSASDLAAGKTAFETTYSCAKSGCHDAVGPDISPSGIGKHTDPQILGTVTSGLNPENATPVSIGVANHSFPIAAGTPESVGICAYMRSLPPGIPKPDL
jgi:hypothetical protein